MQPWFRVSLSLLCLVLVGEPVHAQRTEVDPRVSQSLDSSQYFTVGSTSDEVLAVQGQPDNFTDNTFWYGLSYVSFLNGRVTSWKGAPNNSEQLKGQIMFESPAQKLEYFTVGSTIDEVLAVQGQPDGFVPDNIFWYGMSYVTFRNGRVAKWRGDLKGQR